MAADQGTRASTLSLTTSSRERAICSTRIAGMRAKLQVEQNSSKLGWKMALASTYEGQRGICVLHDSHCGTLRKKCELCSTAIAKI